MTDEEAHSQVTRVALLEQRADRSDETMLKIAEVLERVELFMASSSGQAKGIGISVLVVWSIINVAISIIGAYALLRGLK